MKFTIPQFVVLSLNSLYFEVYSRFYQSTKGLYALLSCRVTCSEPQCFAPRLNASLHAPQAPHSISALKRCHYETQILFDFTTFHNHKRSSQLALKKNFQFLENFNSFFAARFILITERRYLWKNDR